MTRYVYERGHKHNHRATQIGLAEKKTTGHIQSEIDTCYFGASLLGKLQLLKMPP